MDQETKREILLDEGIRARLPDAKAAGPLDAVEEVALAVGLVRPAQHVGKVAQGVDDGEGKEEDSRADSTIAVVVEGKFEVSREEHGLHDGGDDAHCQENKRY